MKKFWIIKKTADFHEKKSSLKEIRKQRNKAAGVDEDSAEFKALSTAEQAEKMPFTISKGPDHPGLA